MWESRQGWRGTILLRSFSRLFYGYDFDRLETVDDEKLPY